MHASLVVIQNAKGHVLLLRRSPTDRAFPDPDGRGKWCLPGGKADPGETPDQTACREVYEETGIRVNLHSDAHCHHYYEKISGMDIVVFDQRVGDSVDVTLSGEHIEARWFPLDALPPDSDMIGELTARILRPYRTPYVVNPFVLRQTEESPFSHFAGDGGWGTIVSRTIAAVAAGATKPGYRDGVLEVIIDPTDVLSGVVVLTDGAELVGTYKPRRVGETPRKEIRAKGARKMPAATASVILYRTDVLAETDDNTLPLNAGGWEIVSLNASPLPGDIPIDPTTLMHNHFGSDGGTATGMSDSDFVTLLRRGFEFWKNKALAG